MAGQHPEVAFDVALSGSARRRARSLSLGIAGFRIGFKSDSPGIISLLGRRYGRFSGNDGGDYSFSVSAAPGKQTPFRPSVLWTGRELRISRGDFRAVLDADAGIGNLFASAKEQCLDAFLRSLLSVLLLRDGGLMLHSAGLVKAGRAYVFIGKSGAGKSTLSRLAAASGLAEVVSDEINMLRPVNGNWRVYGSPFWGEMRAEGRPGSWPLGGVYLLGKSAENSVSSCGRGETLRALLRCLLNFEKGGPAAERILDVSFDLLAGTCLRRFEFSKRDASFMGLLGRGAS